MIKTNNQKIIKELGLSNLSEDQISQRLNNFYITLHRRVGMSIQDKLTPALLSEFHNLNKDEDIKDWLKINIKDLDQLVAKTETDLLAEITNNKRIVADALKV